MKMWVGVTDKKWYEYLASISPDEVNFWKPGEQGFGAIEIGAPPYHRNCAISGEKALPVLQAAHIKPFYEKGPNHINNGLLLRSDLHILFDRGYLTITP